MRYQNLQKLCLVWCVLLVFNDFVGMIHGLQHKYQFDRKNNDGFEEAQEKNDYRDLMGDNCEKWEEYNGIECVCARTDPKHILCDGESGMVCDNQGRQYQSYCHFALNFCQKKISYNESEASCGACKMLRLSYDEKGVPSDYVYFRRVGEDQGNSTVYVSLQDQSTLFFEERLNAWVIGIRNNSGSYASVVQPRFSAYPQDYKGKMLIVSSNATHTVMEATSSLKLQCVSELSVQSKKPKKRFIATLMITIISVVVSVSSIATVTALTVVQHKRGCLYYPSVCTMRDEIKNHLKPQLERMNRDFWEKYGDVDKIKEAASDILTYAMDIKDGLITINDFRNQTKYLFSKLTDDLAFASPNGQAVLENYKLYLDSLENIEGEDLVKYILPNAGASIVAIVSAVTASVSAASLAFNVAGAALSVVGMIVVIVISKKEERELRDKLYKAKSDFIKAKQQIREAEEKMVRFQKAFCRGVLVYLSKLSARGYYYNETFKNLYSKLASLNVYSEDSCNNLNVYSSSKATVLEDLRDKYIFQLKKYVSDYVKEIESVQVNIIATRRLLEYIKKKVKIDRIRPSTLFGTINSYGTDILKGSFPNLFDLLKHISIKLVPTTDCYWGYNLRLIRLGTVTRNNFLHSALCQSSEMSDMDRFIREKIALGINPREIFERVKGFEFRNKYLLVRFIADHILPESKCYWGYDLESARKSRNERELETAKISRGLFTFMKTWTNKSPQGVEELKNILCSVFLVCNTEWQTLLMCSAFGETRVLQLSCTSLLPSCLP